MAEEKVVVDVKAMLEYKSPEFVDKFSNEAAILYALSIGFSKDQLNQKELSYTYENNENFSVFPTFACLLGNKDMLSSLQSIKGLPNFNPMMLLHGEERVEVFRPLKAGVKYVAVGCVSDVADKVKGMLLSFETNLYEEDQDKKRHLTSKVTASVFIRKLGGFGHKGKQGPQIPKKPERKPDVVHVEKTDPSQAILYRLTGDMNPLHIDPEMAAMGGFDKPILHGMCFFGLAAKGALQNFADYDANCLKSINARFTSHVFPGETLEFSYWKNGQQIIFSGKTRERGLDCIQGELELKEKAKL